MLNMKTNTCVNCNVIFNKERIFLQLIMYNPLQYTSEEIQLLLLQVKQLHLFQC